MKPTISVMLCLSCLFVATQKPAHAQFNELVTKVPGAANAVVFINIDKVMASDVAVKGNWKTEHRQTFQAGLTFLPPNASAAVLAAQLNFDSMTPVWSMAAMHLDYVPALPSIALTANGRVDQFGKYPAVALPADSYLIQFAPQVVSAIGPASRQGVARWIKEIDSNSEHRLTGYLQEAYGYASEIGTPIIMAIDLQDVIPTDDIRLVLQESEAYAKIDAKVLDEMVSLLGGVRGITVGITLDTDRPFGKVKVDFAENVNLTSDQAKSLLLLALTRRGAMLDELHEWTPKVSEKFVSLEGYLTRSGLSRLSSLIDRPPAFVKELPKAAPVAAETATATPNNQYTPSQSQGLLPASQEYFVRVNDLIEDLRTKPRESPGYTLGQIAIWYDAYARRIDQLPVNGVDPELVSFSAYASDSLRAAGSRIRSGLVRKRARQVATTVPYDVYTYGMTYGDIFWGGYPLGTETGAVKVPDYQAYKQARAAASAQERGASLTEAKEIMSKLDEATGDIRRRMSEKFKADF